MLLTKLHGGSSVTNFSPVFCRGGTLSKKSLALFLLATAALLGQTSRGTVTGVVTDQTGAGVPGAKVELRNQLTNVDRVTSTTEGGVYRFDAVELGDYTITVSNQGFTTFVRRGLPVQAGQTSNLDVKLEVGQTSTTVEVTAEVQAVLQTESAVRGGNINTQQAVDLPLAGRNPALLALTLPGVSTNRFGFGVGTFSVNGSRGRANNFMIDGTDNNDTGIAGQALQIRNPDAVAEVSVQTSNFDAEFGRAGGAVVNTVTRGGTNQFHGTGFYILDSTFDDAITSLQSQSAEIQQRGRPPAGTEQWWGGTFGGPVIKDRTFFFFGYHEQIQRNSALRNLVVPTANGWATLNSLFPNRSNRFLETYRGLTTGVMGTSRTFTQELGLGRPAVEFGTALIPLGRRFNDRQIIARGDHKIGNNDQLSVRYASTEQTNSTGGTGVNVFPGYETGFTSPVINAVVNETHVFSPRLTNELRLSYARISFEFPNNGTAGDAQVAPNYTFPAPLTGLGVPIGIPQGRIQNNYTIQNTISWVRGSHTFRGGVDLVKQRGRDLAPYRDRPQYAYGNSTGFSAFANFLDDFGGANGAAILDFGSPANYPEVFRQGYFFQDRWRVNRDLTLTLGVRYDYLGQPINALRYTSFSGLFNVNPQTLDGPYRQPSRVQEDRNNWSPTVGLAYSPGFQSGWLGWLFGDHKSVIRTGYQMSYDLFFNNILSNAATSTPNLISTNTQSIATGQNPRGLAGFTSSLPTTAREPLPSDVQVFVSPNLVAPYTQRWSFGIQRELQGGFLLDVSYVGTKGTRLFINEDLNPVVPSSLRVTYPNVNPRAVIQPRLDTLQGQRLTRTNGGDSNYHGLQTAVNRRFRNGLGLTGSYTWSKAIDNAAEVFGVGAVNQPQQAAVPSIFGGQKLDRAVSFFDRTHRAVFTYTYEFPWMKAQQGFAGRLIGGWSLAGVTTFETGVPLTIVNGVDADGLGGALDRPDYNPNGQRNVRAVPNATSPTGYVNPDNNNAPINAADAMYIGLPVNTGATPLRTGNLGRNTERTPGISNFDVTAIKNIRLNERVRFELRGEMFNIFNHPQYTVGSVSPFSPAAGGVPASVFNSAATQFLNPGIADGGGRVIRYNLRIIF